MYRRICKLFVPITILLGFTIITDVVFAFPSKKYNAVNDFVGGINLRDARICRERMQAAKCNLKTMLNDFKYCVRAVLLKHPVCKQTLVFFNLTSGAVIKSIKRYHNIDAIVANCTYIAEQGRGYFLITKSGQYLTLPMNVSQQVVKKAPGYKAIAKRYPRVGLWQILHFPVGERLSHHRYRLVFTQQLKDGCNACAVAGTAKVAYDFTRNGKKFHSIKILKLTGR